MRHIIILLILLCSVATVQSKENFNNSNVSIPWSDFRRILKDLKTDTVDTKPPAKLPAAYVISDALYEARQLHENEFLVSATLTVNVLEPEDWIEISLGRALSIYPDIQVDKKVGTVGMKDNGTSFVIIKNPGKHIIKYKFKIPQQIASGQSSLSFPMPGQTVARLKLKLDRPSYTVLANNRTLVMKRSGREYIYEGGLGSSKKAYINWQQETSNINGQQAMVMGQMNTIYSIGMGMIQLKSQINLNVIHKDIRQFSFVVPKYLEVIDFTGHAVATWEAKDSLDQRIITAYLKYSLRDKSSFLLNSEFSYNDTVSKISLPSLSLQNATREEGIIGVGVLGNVELKPLDNSNNVLRRDKRELPNWFNDQGDVLYVYQYLSGNYSIDLKLTPHGNIPVLDALVTGSNINSVIRDDGKMVTQIDMTVRNRGEQFLRLGWKPKWQVWSVYCNNEPARPAFDTINGELLIPLKKATDKTAETEVKLIYLSLQNPFKIGGKQNIDYPHINMPIQRARGALYMPETIKSFWQKGNLNSTVVKDKSKWFSSLIFNLYVPKQMAEGFVSQSVLPSAPVSSVKRKSMKKSAPKKGLNQRSFEKESLFGALDMEEADMNIAQALVAQTGFEAGQLSIPVVINFEGLASSYETPLMKSNEVPTYSFFYYKGSRAIPPFLNYFLNFLMLIMAVVLTNCIYKKFSKAKIIYGLAIPFILTFTIYRVFNKPFNIDIFFIIPILFLALILLIKFYGLIVSMVSKIRTNISESRKVMEKIDSEYDEKKKSEKKSEDSNE